MVAAYYQQDFMGTMPFVPTPYSMNAGVAEFSDRKMTDKPTHTDILLGRGVGTNRHPGNENFRAIVSQHVDVYVISTKKQKMTISRSIVEKVQTELDPPGRFLERNADTGLWHEVEIKRSLEKTAQALRDGAAPLRKQLSEDMKDPTFLNVLFEGGKGKAGKRALADRGIAQKGKKHRRKITPTSITDVVSSGGARPAKKHRPNSEGCPGEALREDTAQLMYAHQPTMQYLPQLQSVHQQVNQQQNVMPYQSSIVQYDVQDQVPVDVQHAFFDPRPEGTNIQSNGLVQQQVPPADEMNSIGPSCSLPFVFQQQQQQQMTPELQPPFDQMQMLPPLDENVFSNDDFINLAMILGGNL